MYGVVDAEIVYCGLDLRNIEVDNVLRPKDMKFRPLTVDRQAPSSAGKDLQRILYILAKTFWTIIGAGSLLFPYSYG
jgi:hypothetical protein